ncbi:TPA: sugar phosphate isomerase/epimerase [Candidatus Poribacteria bacterium]|nr:sugar phosphate isomerase/epimerase [Candidatus Poribacteria bacterium]
MKVGCCAYSFRQYLSSGEMSLFDFLEKGVEIGLDGVELTSYYFPSTDDEFLYSLKRKAYLLGLEISGTAVGNNFCLADEAERAKQVTMTKSWIDNSVKLGAPCMRVFAGGAPSGHAEEEARNWCIDSLKECLDYAKPRGILLALENHGGITSTAEQTLAIIKAVDDEWLGVNLDTGNYRNAYEGIEKTAPYAITCHAKTEIPGPSGKEIADFRKIADILAKAGYKGYLSIEYEAAEDPMTAVEKFVSYLKEIVG